MAGPLNYISRADPPIMIVHGEHHEKVPHAQGERLYQALNKACHDAQFLSLPLAEHGIWNRMMTDPKLRTTRPCGRPKRPVAAPIWHSRSRRLGSWSWTSSITR